MFPVKILLGAEDIANGAHDLHRLLLSPFQKENDADSAPSILLLT